MKSNQPFIPVTFQEAKARLGAIASLDIWQTFEYDELTINMRQNGDAEYAELLSNLRTGKLTNHHHSLLQERMVTSGARAPVASICDDYSRLVNEGKSPLILMPRTSLCDEVNRAMLTWIEAPIYLLPATDTLDTIVDKK